MLPPPLLRYFCVPAVHSFCLDVGVSEPLGTSGASRPLVFSRENGPDGVGEDKSPSNQMDLNAQRALYIDNHTALGVDPFSPLLAAQDMKARLDNLGIVSSLA